MKAVIYFTEVPQQYEHKNMEHMIGEKLLATGLYKEYGLKLAFEPRLPVNMANHSLPCSRRYIIILHIPANM